MTLQEPLKYWATEFAGAPTAQYSSRIVDDAVPIIYARSSRPELLTLGGRIGALAIALGCLTPLVIAACLHPSPDGFGSHTELGLARCQFLQRTGLPCPSCGMTTSWAWFARGNLEASLYVQPFGTVLAMLAACCFWVALYVAATGRPVYQLLRVAPSRYYFVPLVSIAILAWGWKIYIHLSGRDGWHY